MKTSTAIKNTLFTLLIPGTVGFYLPLWIGRSGDEATDWWNWPGLLFLAAGAGILLLCILDFGKKGEGTPFPLDPPKNLVTGRLYRFSRNPMYVGVLTVVAGWAIWFSDVRIAAYWLAVALLFHAFVVLVEEPYLKKQFGSAYMAYCEKVPRWFLAF